MDATITVPGVGRVSSRPDCVVLVVGAAVTRPTVAEATALVAERMAAILAALRSQGVAEDDVSTNEYSVGPRFEYPPDSGPRLAGYDATSTFEVRLRDVVGAGSVIDAAVAAAGDQCVVNGIRFERTDAVAAEETARRAAFEDAARRAGQLAELAGTTLGRVVRVVEGGSGAPGPPAGVFAMAKRDAVPIQPGQIVDEVRIEVVFGLGSDQSG